LSQSLHLGLGLVLGLGVGLGLVGEAGTLVIWCNFL
jgi:hypothetical protein